MTARQLKFSLLGASAFFALSFTLVPGALAHDSAVNETEMEHQSQTAIEHSNKSASQPRLRACQAHEHVINATMQRIAARGQRHLEVFDKISTRVETFATTK